MKLIEILSAVFLVMCLTLAGLPQAGALPILPSGKENPLPILYPELNTAPAPPWWLRG